MKLTAILATIILSVMAIAQTAASIENAFNNLEIVLKNGNCGSVESAIFHSVKLKLFHPDKDTEKLESEIHRLIEDGETETIRYIAYLAYQFLRTPGLLAKVEKKDYKNGDEFFQLLSDVMTTQLLVNR